MASSGSKDNGDGVAVGPRLRLEHRAGGIREVSILSPGADLPDLAPEDLLFPDTGAKTRLFAPEASLRTLPGALARVSAPGFSFVALIIPESTPE